MSPKRIQMTRQRPWRAEHPDAVIVARPSKWGNPFTVNIPHGEALQGSTTRALLANRYQLWLTTGDSLQAIANRLALSTKDGRHFIENFAPTNRPTLSQIRADLAGHDLACWCPLNQPCHADVLLEIANRDWSKS